MSVDSIKSVVAGKTVEATEKSAVEKADGNERFDRVLERELQGVKEKEKAGAAGQGSNFAVFPVYEVGDLDNLPQSSDLRERGIRDTEQLIEVLDKYRQGLDRERLDPDKMKETVQVLDQVSRDMMEYINQVEHGELADLMQESLVMARVEVEKYSRGDYS